MNFATLYKRAKTGKVVSYRIWVDDNTTDGNPVIMKETGQLDGKKTVHTETIFEGKQKRTPVQQAENQAQSDWKKKRDEGYKSLEDLGITDHGDYVNKDGQDLSLQEMLGVQLPEFNTDASGEMKPMKAPTDPWKPGVKLKLAFPLREEAKLDGLRSFCYITRKGGTIDVKFKSSGGKPYDTVTHLVELVKAKAHIFPPDDTVILDVELYRHGWLLEEINAAVKKYRPGITEEIEMWLLDAPHLTETQLDRSDYVEQVAKKLEVPVPEYKVVHNEREAIEAHNDWVERGFEGGMLKDINGTYQPGQRSSFWKKVKMFDDTEFAFKNFEFGQRGAEDLIAVCWVDSNEHGGDKGVVEFRAKIKGSKAMKEAMYERGKNGELEGKSFTVKHFGYSKYGIPNLPTGKCFRDER